MFTVEQYLVEYYVTAHKAVTQSIVNGKVIKQACFHYMFVQGESCTVCLLPLSVTR